MPLILIIDDSDEFRFNLRNDLEKLGFDVIEASDGNSGVDLYKSNEPDLVITDIIMPEKDGIEVIMEIKEIFPDAKIFAISGAERETFTLLDNAIALGAERAFFKTPGNQEIKRVVLADLKKENHHH